MTTPSVSRHDITLVEEMLHVSLLSDVPYWTASLDGTLSTGESAQMSRGANTSAEALATLEAAIAENGWMIR